MSLLPGQILPPSTPLGRVNEDGTVSIDTNWWLLLYNLCIQSLGTQGGLPASALESVETIDFDISTSDIPTLARQIANLSAQLPEEQVVPTLLQVVNALTLAVNASEAQVPIGTLPATNGGTGQTQYAVGDLLYSGIANSLSRLTGNITTTKKFLTQTGSGSASASPAWGIISSTDLPGSFTGFANPSATIGLTAVNGTAQTAMTSDSAPPLSQAISPTWSGSHTFSLAITVNGAGTSLKGGVTITAPASGSALTLTGVSSAAAVTLNDGGSAQPLVLNSTAAAGGYMAMQRGAANKFFVGDASQLSGGTLDDLTIRCEAGLNLATGGGNTRLNISSAGAWRINGQATTGAQTASFSATNKPGAASGSPQKWLPLNADGTTYYVPLFS